MSTWCIYVPKYKYGVRIGTLYNVILFNSRVTHWAVAPSRLYITSSCAMTSLQSKPSCYHTTHLHINSTSHTSQSRCRNCRDFDVTAMLSCVFLATECCKLRWPINVLERRRVVWSCISASTYVWQNNGKAALSWQHVMGLLCAVV